MGCSSLINIMRIRVTHANTKSWKKSNLTCGGKQVQTCVVIVLIILVFDLQNSQFLVSYATNV